MIDETSRAALSRAVADVLERMFFLEPVAEADAPPSAADPVTVHLAFDGDPPGCFRLRLDRSAAAAIAADFLGEDAASLTPRQSTEVTLELANMICGAALSQIESGAAFRLGTPEILTGQLVGTGPPQEDWYTVDTGSGALSAAIQMETRSCPAPPRSAS